MTLGSSSPSLEEESLLEGTPEHSTEGSDDEGQESVTEDRQWRIHRLDLGVWRLFYASNKWEFLPGVETLRNFREMGKNLIYLWRFIKELWEIAPVSLVLWFFLEIWGSMQNTASLWVKARMLQTIQDLVSQKDVDVNAVRIIFGLKFLQIVSEGTYNIAKSRCSRVFENQVIRLAASHMIDICTRMDLRTLQRRDVQATLRKMTDRTLGDNVWNEFISMLQQLMGLVDVASQAIFFVTFFLNHENGFSLMLACLLPQLLENLLNRSIYRGPWFAHVVNKTYLRMCTLGRTATDTDYFEEIISCGLGQYLRAEHHKASVALGETSVSSYHDIIWSNTSVWKSFARLFTRDLSLIYYLATVAWNPSSFSLTSLTILRESSNSFASTLYLIFGNHTLGEKLLFLRDYYTLLETKNEIADGVIPYPSSGSLEREGMKIEFRNVSMKYPRSQKFALKTVSFTIPAGSTVILVGANGSGKTTTVSLLSRLFEVTSGEILIDDRPISEYDSSMLRDAQAILRQGYQHFPFSIKENIGMGDPLWLESSDQEAHMGSAEERVMRAARLGGADEIIDDIKDMNRKSKEAFARIKIEPDPSWSLGSLFKGVAGRRDQESRAVEEDEKSEDGWETSVKPISTWEGNWLNDGSTLSKLSDGVEKRLELSGGQWQRLALARLFMRADREQVRLICADEPSAALDPRAEYDVFQRLRTLRGRKTTRIFITHRFGHLTKHADLILCFKKGEIVEAGSHNELMKLNGEYATLYNIQAQAFQTA
ncbi:P-loop containing nucleoside triphosphate hydrolase protein [Serendipita vermifera]|nr:P-loop containing nucleoside triphosphate hydrolase protein [Serendipita vermifera]